MSNDNWTLDDQLEDEEDSLEDFDDYEDLSYLYNDPLDDDDYFFDVDIEDIDYDDFSLPREEETEW